MEEFPEIALKETFKREISACIPEIAAMSLTELCALSLALLELASETRSFYLDVEDQASYNSHDLTEQPLDWGV